MSIAAYQGVCPKCRHYHSAPVTALASGSGDHAELAKLAEILMDEARGVAEMPRNEKRDEQAGYSALASVALTSLLAEIAALRASASVIEPELGDLEATNADLSARLTEAERKLAEAVATLELAAIRFDEIYEAAEVDDVAYRNEATIHGINGLADVAQADRTFLSKEAERG